MKKIIWSLLIIVLLVGGLWYLKINYYQPTLSQPANPTLAAPTLVASANYICNGAKAISADFYKGGSQQPAAAGSPPMPNGSVKLTLSDGRNLTLKQTISADGGRYTSSDGSIIFWNKGNSLIFTENGQTTYANCLAVAPDSGHLSQIYADKTGEFSLRYPNNYIVNEQYAYQALGPGKNIKGVKFTIDPAIASGTNLAADTYLSIETIPQASDCRADLFLDPAALNTPPQILKENNTIYSIASSTGAGAGNRYEESVYALPGTNPCLAIRYFIHYGVIENYPPGLVANFNHQIIYSAFDQIRRSLILNQAPAPLTVNNLTSDLYPLYLDLSWTPETAATTSVGNLTLNGWQTNSSSKNNVTDLAAIFLPFQKYYDAKLKASGWLKEEKYSADGAGSSFWVYIKGHNYIVFSYKSIAISAQANTPFSCPCNLSFTIFFGSQAAA